MDMGRVVRWSRKLSVNKVAWFLRSWYVFLPACCFLPEMEGGILSYKEHLIKPEPEIYQLLLKRYGLKAEESVFLDDTLKNVEAAEEQGIHGIHFLTKEQAEEELRKLGVDC